LDDLSNLRENNRVWAARMTRRDPEFFRNPILATGGERFAVGRAICKLLNSSNIFVRVPLTRRAEVYRIPALL
jgi:hypothetical protein